MPFDAIVRLLRTRLLVTSPGDGPSEQKMTEETSMRSRSLILSLALISLAVATGCPSITSMHTARPIGPGDFELQAVPVIEGVGGGDTGSSSNVVGWPWFEFGMRYGINENMDFGVRYIPPLQVSGDVNIAFVNTGSFALSIDPTIQPWGVFGADSDSGSDAGVFMVWAYLPLMMDVVGTETFALTLNIKPALLYASATADSGGDRQFVSGVSYFLGGGAGIKIMFTDTFGIMPEFDVLYGFEGEAYWFTAGLGFLFTL